jgi:hypothetical protein
MNKKYLFAILALVMAVTLAQTAPAFADNNNKSGDHSDNRGSGLGEDMRGGMIKPGIFGTVTLVNGNSITISGRQGLGQNTGTVTFTIDATNAKIMKNNVLGTIASITVGDTIMAEGTLTGTNLVATTIRDGSARLPKDKKPGENIPPFAGNGQPVVAGTVSAVSGSTVTITNKSNVTYTIDAANAKVMQGTTIIAVSNIAIGDVIVVQGTINGNSIVASSIMDQQKPAGSTDNNGKHKGFFGSIGSFFSRIFGF